MKNPRISSTIGLSIVGSIFAAAFVSLFWTPYDVTYIDTSARFLLPAPSHPLGTDHLGRDILSMLVAGARASISIATTAILFGAVIGIVIGLLGAASGGLVDEASMRLNDIIFAFPALITAILVAAIFGAGGYAVIIAIALFNVPVFARLTRGSALSLWRQEFVLAARTAGKSKLRISIEHILPNLAPILIVQATIQFSLAILAEAGLSYVGLGVQPPSPSWGRMLADGQSYAPLHPWIAIAPGAAIVLFVVGVNLVGDAIKARLLDHNAYDLK